MNEKITTILIGTLFVTLLFVGCITEEEEPEPTYIQILSDSTFDMSADSGELISSEHGFWYESRNQAQHLLTLDTTDIGGCCPSKKAKITGDQSLNTYVTQEFSEEQFGIFTVEWDIYIDEVMDCIATNTNRDRTGWMLIGFDGGSGPNRLEANRFVYMAFDQTDNLGGDTAELVTRNTGTGFDIQTVQKVMNLDQWYTIKVVLDIPNYTYDLYVDNEFINTVETWNSTALNFGNGASHISFASWNDGPGTFYVDNVKAYYLVED